MAAFERRETKDGKVRWHAKVRRTGWPKQSRTFATKAKAERWVREVERAMDGGAFYDPRQAQRTSLEEAIDRYRREVTPTKRRVPGKKPFALLRGCGTSWRRWRWLMFEERTLRRTGRRGWPRAGQARRSGMS
jgi:hypothetical protein